MSPTDELADLFGQWRILTEHEGRTIDSGAWSELDHVQAGKASLQPRITEMLSRIDRVTFERRFRLHVEELIQLEHRNLAVLQTRRGAAAEEEQRLDRTRRKLRQIQKSYLPPARLHWQSYS